MTEDEMIGWHQRLNVHELEQAPGDGEGQGGPACCSPWGHKESDMTERLNWTELSLARHRALLCPLLLVCQFLFPCLILPEVINENGNCLTIFLS